MSLSLALGQEEAAVSACADVWARSVACRDGGPVQVERAVAGVRRRLELPGSSLWVASETDAVVGFALTAPIGSELELFHLAVEPDWWGRGVAEVLLARVERDATRASCDSIALWVIDANARAVDLYVRHGWVDAGETLKDPGGRTERRLRKIVHR